MAKYRYWAPVWARAAFDFETEHEPGTEKFQEDAMEAEPAGHEIVAGSDGSAFTHMSTEYMINDKVFDEELTAEEIEYRKMDEEGR